MSRPRTDTDISDDYQPHYCNHADAIHLCAVNARRWEALAKTGNEDAVFEAQALWELRESYMKANECTLCACGEAQDDLVECPECGKHVCGSCWDDDECCCWGCCDE